MLAVQAGHSLTLAYDIHALEAEIFKNLNHDLSCNSQGTSNTQCLSLLSCLSLGLVLDQIGFERFTQKKILNPARQVNDETRRMSGPTDPYLIRLADTRGQSECDMRCSAQKNTAPYRSKLRHSSDNSGSHHLRSRCRIDHARINFPKLMPNMIVKRPLRYFGLFSVDQKVGLDATSQYMCYSDIQSRQFLAQRIRHAAHGGFGAIVDRLLSQNWHISWLLVIRLCPNLTNGIANCDTILPTLTT